ncbi:DUF924 family protein [uncultured Ferrimonas sp.]|uniref:DUF924 family protein n=1 Tax=uncultured Ferrimonas sp. TaxID=432640 RepID=UPI002637B647|nr:DUF924 family protein [uncultured Ferrimonas sp.]
MNSANDVLEFWFTQCTPAQWFAKDVQFDRLIQQRFGGLHQQAQAGELFQWRSSSEGRLAEVIVLDQFSRNLYRDQAQAFACDPMALVLAQQAVAAGADSPLTPQQRGFLYMPYMHSESALIHQQAALLYQAKGLEHNLRYELQHKQIIDRFGRYPHRNAILGRASTEQELQFLSQPGSSF